MAVTTSAKTRLETQVKQAEVVKLTFAGLTNVDIAERLGCTESTVRYHKRSWVESIQPADERAHELRETWGGRLEVAHQRNWPQVEDGDAKAIEVMLRIQAQFAKLFGLELQPGITVNVLTAEGMAAALGLDPTLVVDVEAKEITDGSADA